MSYGTPGQPGGYGQPEQPQGAPQPAWGQQPGQPLQQPPPGAPAGQSWGQSLGASANKATAGFDAKALPWWRWGSLAIFVLWIVAVSLPWASYSAYGYSASASGWNGGLNVFAFILFLLAAAAAAVVVFMKTTMPIPTGFIIGGLLALGALFGVIEFLTVIGAYIGFGAFVGLVVALLAAACAAFEIMDGLKAPKAATAAPAGQWGQAAPPAGQWGQAAPPPAVPPAGGWNQPAPPPPAPQQNWGTPTAGPPTGATPTYGTDPQQQGGQPNNW